MRKLHFKALLILSTFVLSSAWIITNSINASAATTTTAANCPKGSIKLSTLPNGCASASDLKNPDKLTKFDYVTAPHQITKPVAFVKLDDELKKGSDDPVLDFAQACTADQIAFMNAYLAYLKEKRSVDLQNQVLRAKYSQTDGMKSYPKDIEKTYIKLVQDRYLAKVKEQAKDNTKKQQDQVAAFSKDVNAALEKRHTERYNAAKELYSNWVQLATDYYTVANASSEKIYELRSKELANFKAACATSDSAKIKAAYLTFNKAGQAEAKAVSQKFTEYYGKKTGKIGTSYVQGVKKIDQSETTYQKKLCDLRGAVKGSDGKPTKASEKYCKKNQKGKYTAVLAAVAKKAASTGSSSSNGDTTVVACTAEQRKDKNSDCYPSPDCRKDQVLNQNTKECVPKPTCKANEAFDYSTLKCESKKQCKKTSGFSLACFEGKYSLEKPCVYTSKLASDAGQLTKYAVDSNGNKKKLGPSGIVNLGACPAKGSGSDTGSGGSGGSSSADGSGSSSHTCQSGYYWDPRSSNGSGNCLPTPATACAQSGGRWLSASGYCDRISRTYTRVVSCRPLPSGKYSRTLNKIRTWNSGYMEDLGYLKTTVTSTPC